MKEYISMWKNFTDFSGRSTLRDYWMAVLFNVIVSLILGIVARLIDTSAIISIYSCLTIIPGLALTIRRLHDSGKTALSLLYLLIPGIGIIILIFLLCKPSNKYM